MDAIASAVSDPTVVTAIATAVGNGLFFVGRKLAEKPSSTRSSTFPPQA